MNEEEQSIEHMAAQLLSAVSYLESLPSNEQKAEYADRTLKTVANLPESMLCLMAFGGPKGQASRCATCGHKDDPAAEQRACPFSTQDDYRVMPVGEAETFHRCLLLWGDSAARSRQFSDLLTSFLTVLAITIGKNNRKQQLILANQQLKEEITQRRQATEKLRLSEGHLVATLQSIGDGVVTCDRSGRISSLNAQAEHLTGWTNAAALGTPAEEIIHLVNARSRKTIDAPLTRALSDRIEIKMDAPAVLIARDGSEHLVTSTCTPIRDTHGQTLGAVLVFRDVSNEYRQRKRMRESEERFARILSTVPDMVSVHDTSHNIVYCNWRGFGAVPEAQRVIGSKCYSTFRGRAKPCPDCRAMKAIHQKAPVEAEVLLPGGSWVDVRAVPLLNENGDCELVVEWVRDITERKRMEDALRGSEEKYRCLFNQLREGIYLHDLQGQIIEVNQMACLQSGYSKGELLQLSVFDLHPPASGDLPVLPKEDVLSAWQNMSPGETNIIETVHRRKDGTLFPVRLAMSLFHYTTKRLMLATVQDVSERQETERTLRESEARALALAKRAEEANASKNDFLRNITHELRTPLNGSLGIAQLLKDTPLDEEQHELLDIAISSGKQLNQLINNLLLFYKLETQTFQPNAAPFDPREELIPCSEELQINAAMRGIAFDCVVDPGVPQQVTADGPRLISIIRHLADNAIKFTEKGGVSVSLSLLKGAIPASDITLDEPTRGKQFLLLTVRDTGIGIPPEKQHAIFEKFYQVDASTTRRYAGTGIGLTLAKEMIDAMGGSIRIASQPGQGTEVRVIIPVQEHSPASQGEGTPPPSMPDHQPGNVVEKESLKDCLKDIGGHILVVEDDSTNRLVCLNMLGKFGLTADAALHGAEALEAAQRKHYDAILMDVQMPVMDGLEATEHIRRTQQPCSSVPIIALTAQREQATREVCLAAGMNDHVEKPIDPRDLVAVLKKHLSANRESTTSREENEDTSASQHA